MTLPYRKKLIEVALPLPEINDASAHDKRPGIGPHPKGIHHWWARLPLPTARAVLFASVVDDPSSHPEKWPTDEAQSEERERLFDIIRKMMGKKLHEHPEVYAEARSEIIAHCDNEIPVVFDPFAGGGSIPLEASRMGFEAHAGDLNPVAVLMNKCNLELAPKWVGHPPINPDDRKRIGGTEAWRGTHGLAADVRYYGQRISERARAKIGHLYPKARLPEDRGAGEAAVIAWIWARTVASPDPAAQGAHVPLISTYWLSSKKDHLTWLEPVVDRAKGTWHYEVRTGTPTDRDVISAGTKTGHGANSSVFSQDRQLMISILSQSQRQAVFASKLIAIVADTNRGRCYLPSNPIHSQAALVSEPNNIPREEMANDPRNIWCIGYGVERFDQLFTRRQLTGLVTLSDLVKQIDAEIRKDSAVAGLTTEESEAYVKTVKTFLARGA